MSDEIPELSPKPNKSRSLWPLIGAIFIMAWFMGTVWISDYLGRQSLVDSQQYGCERTKSDRKATIRINHAILNAFKDTDRRNPDPLTDERIAAEIMINRGIVDLEKRISINCTKVHPNASLIP